MAGPWDVVSVTPVAASGGGRGGGWDVVSQEPIPEPPRRDMLAGLRAMLGPTWIGQEALPKDAIPRDDFSRMAVDSATFGLADKAAAKASEMLGGQSYARGKAENQRETEAANQRSGPGASFAANALGGLLTGSALARGGVSVLGHVPQNASILTKILAGAVEGGLYGAANEAGHSKADTWKGVAQDATGGILPGAAVGGTLSAAAGVIPRIITPNIADSAERTRMAEALRAQGVDVKASQVTGARNLATIEDAAQRLPMGRMLSAVTPESQMEQLTQAAMKKAGVQGEAATESALRDAYDRVGGTIGSINKKYNVLTPDAQFASDIGNVLNDLPVLSRDRQSQVREFLKRAAGNFGTIDTDKAQVLREQLRRARTFGDKTDNQFNSALDGIRNAVDDLLERTIVNRGNPGDAKLLRDARQTYANIHVLENALWKSGADGQLGYLTPAALKNAQAASIGKHAVMTGKGDMTELAKAAAAVLPTKAGSQTAERAASYNPIKWALSIPLNLAVNSRPAQAYLSNQLLPRQMNASPAVLQGLLAGGQNMRGGLL